MQIIDNKEGLLIPGMYVRGRIRLKITKVMHSQKLDWLGKGISVSYLQLKKKMDDGVTEWAFKPVEVIAGINDNGWIEVKLLNPLPTGTIVAWNNAYYLLAEMKKGEAEHSH